MCDGPCTVYVVEIRRGVVRLGFKADKVVPIHREEVQRAIDRNKNKPKAA